MPDENKKENKGQSKDENIKAMRELVALSKKRTKMAEKRTQMAEDRSRMSEDRSRMSEDRSRMSAARSYMNAERTLSVWVRTALSSMIFGIAIDRFGLLVAGKSTHPHNLFGHPSTPTSLIGAALVFFSILMSITAASRFITFSKQYKKEFPLPSSHGFWLPATYAFMVAFFGAVLIVVMWLIK